jgi:hypothetical protein
MNVDSQRQRLPGSKTASFALSVGLISSQAVVGSLSNRGIDTTDEGYYMSSIRWADHYKAGISGFGDFYSIFYKILGEDFGALRELNTWFNWLTWVVFGWLFASYMIRTRLWTLGWDQRILVALAAGAFSNFSLLWWIFTPSYNSLAFQGVTIFAIGLLISRLWGTIAIPILGIGLVISFIGKPSTTIVLVALLLIAIPPNNLRNLGIFSGAGAVSLSLLFLWGIHLDESLVSYAQRLQKGIEITSQLDAGQFIWDGNAIYRIAAALWPFTGLEPWSVALISSAVIGLSMTLITVCHSYLMLNRLIVVALGVFGFITFSLALLGILFNRGPYAPYQISMIVFLSAIFTSMWIVFQETRTQRMRPSNSAGLKSDWRLPIVLFLLPIAYAFGTNNSYWVSASAIAGMFMASGLLLGAMALRVAPNHSIAIFRFSSLSVMAGLMVVAVTLVGASMFPYRQHQGALLMKKSDFVPGIYVSDSTEEYLGELLNVSELYSIVPSTPLIDNTGNSPLAILILGGTPLGSAWVGGGYPGSALAAKTQLSSYSEDCLSQAWVLDSPRGTQRVLNLDEGYPRPYSSYEMVATFKNPHSNEEQVLYRPRLRETRFVGPCFQDTSEWSFTFGSSR